MTAIDLRLKRCPKLAVSLEKKLLLAPKRRQEFPQGEITIKNLTEKELAAILFARD